MHDQSASRISGRTRAAASAMCVRALRITVLKSAGNFTRDECHDLSAEKIQRVKCFMFTRYGICCVPAIFERRRGRLGSKISGCGQLAEVAVYFAMSGLPPEADIKRKGRHVHWAAMALNRCAIARCAGSPTASAATGGKIVRGCAACLRTWWSRIERSAIPRPICGRLHLHRQEFE